MRLTSFPSPLTAGGVESHPDSGRSQPGQWERGAQQPAQRNAATWVSFWVNEHRAGFSFYRNDISLGPGKAVVYPHDFMGSDAVKMSTSSSGKRSLSVEWASKLAVSTNVREPWNDCLLCYLYRTPENQGGGEADELGQTVLWKAAAEWKDAKNSGACLGAYTSLEILSILSFFFHRQTVMSQYFLWRLIFSHRLVLNAK